jgi:hypothetical protein
MNTNLIEAAATGAQLQVVLTAAERAALLECEAIIRQGRAVFVQVGQALSRIRDSRLYREKYSTFEEYCLEEWEISDRFARNLRSAADVVEVLQKKNFAVLPATESQARPLTKLPREDWAEAWEEVVHDGVRVTANRVAEVVQRRINRVAGISTDTEVVAKGEEHRTSNIEHPTPKGETARGPADGVQTRLTIIDSGTREERVRAQAKKVSAELRALLDVIGTADSLAAASVSLAIGRMDDLQYNLSRKETLLDSRKKERGSL